jgi:hypothetical protein
MPKDNSGEKLSEVWCRKKEKVATAEALLQFTS